jgi:hypothetical protein
LIVNKGPSRDYVLKFIVTDRYDCGATEYIRFKITKTTNPTFHDMLSDNVFTQTTEEYQLKLNEYQKYKQEINPQQKSNLLTSLTRQSHFEGKTQAAVVDTKKIKDAAIKKLNEWKNQMRKCKVNTDKESSVKVRVHSIGSQYYFYYYRKEGWLVDTFQRFNEEVKYLENTTAIEQTLINKVTCKLLNYKNITTTEIKALITYINREKPEWDILTQVMPLIYTILINTQKCEQFIANLTLTKEYDMIKTIRTMKPEKVPNSLWNAITDFELITYLMYRTRQIFGKVKNFH